MTACYVEFEPVAAEWLRRLIEAGHIAPGVVFERDIRNVRPDELFRFKQVHLFAGIGIWSHAIRCAGWSDNEPIWTVSCPCQPFSNSGAGKGFADERHLWPSVDWLIQQCQPSKVIGEQVASPIGLEWFDLVSADMENKGYAIAAADLCAAGVGEKGFESRFIMEARKSVLRCADLCSDPVLRASIRDFASDLMSTVDGGHHIRQRLYFCAFRMGDGIGAGLQRLGGNGDGKAGRTFEAGPIAKASIVDGLADNQDSGRHGGAGLRDSGQGEIGRNIPADSGATIGLSDADENGRIETRGSIAKAGNDGVVRNDSALRMGNAGCKSSERNAGSVSTKKAASSSAGCEDGRHSDGHSNAGDSCRMADANSPGTQFKPGDNEEKERLPNHKRKSKHDTGIPERSGADGDGPGFGGSDGLSVIGHNRANSHIIFRRNTDWLFCRDGKFRPVESRTFPLANEVAGRVGKLCAYGNGLDAETAIAFIKTVKDIIEDQKLDQG